MKNLFKRDLEGDNEELALHRASCLVHRTLNSATCNCDHNQTKEMPEGIWNEFLNSIKELARKDFWFGFERAGIQIDIFNAINKHRKGYGECWVSGPNQIYKSTTAQELLKDALRRENKYRDWPDRPLHILILTPKQSLQVSGFQRTFLKSNAQWLLSNMPTKPSLKGMSKAWASCDFINGDHIQWETFDAGVSYIESVSADLVICEEIFPFEFYEYLTQRLVAQQGLFYASMIPDSRTCDIYTKVFGPVIERGEVDDLREVIVGNEKHYIDANGLALAQFFRKKLSGKLYRIKICGEWIALGKLVYNWDEDVHWIDPFEVPENWARFITIDWANTENDDMPLMKQKRTVAPFIAIPPPGTEITLRNGNKVISTQNEPVYVCYNYYGTGERKIAKNHAESIVKLWETRVGEGWTEKFQKIKIDAATDIKDGTVDKSVFGVFAEVFNKFGQGWRTEKSTNKKRYAGKNEKRLIGHDLVETIIEQNRFLIMRKPVLDPLVTSITSYMYDQKTGEPQAWGDDDPDAIRYLLNDYVEWEDPNQLTPPPQERIDEEAFMVKSYFGIDIRKKNVDFYEEFLERKNQDVEEQTNPDYDNDLYELESLERSVR